jgi:type II secretory pathway predicted ATPase ExeA/outer membrane protein OmpA-like peptidoglycan-associated protein
MYQRHYNLKAKPFQITVDPRFLWLGSQHAEALATLKYGILENNGFLLLTGNIGTGKTALVKRLVRMIDVAAIVATIPDPNLDSLDFFNILSAEFKMNKKFESKGAFLIHFKKFLYKATACHKKVLLIIDEAQRLNSELLEQIRLLSNIELDNRKLINIFFVGQSEFNNLLREERNKAFRQRITVQYHLKPLTAKETYYYIRHRLKVAGGDRKIFSPDAVREIFSFSRGYPRLINIICDQALLSGYATNLKTVDVDVIKESEKRLQILTEIERKDRQKIKALEDKNRQIFSGWKKYQPLGKMFGIFALIAVVLVITGFLQFDSRSEDRPHWTMEEIALQKKEAQGGIQAVMPFLERKTIVYFQRNSDSVFDMAIETLDRIAEFMISNPESRITIKGYTDSTGIHGHDVNVSQLRANTVKSYLVGKGVAAPNIKAVGFGSENPIDSNVTEKGRRKNRRVEIELNLIKKG